MPDKHGPQRTLAGRFIERVNGGRISDGGKVAVLGDLGVREVTIDGFEEELTAGGDQVTVLAPAGSRNKEASGLEGYFMGWGLGMNQVTLETGTAFAVDPTEFFTGETWIQNNDITVAPSDQWWPKNYAPDDGFAENGKMLVVLGENSPEEMFGISAEKMPGQRIEKGETFERYKNFFVIAGPHNITDLGDELKPENVFTAGSPAPLRGASFGMGVVSTPTAEVGGKKQNPFATKDIETLLQSKRATDMLNQAGLTNDDKVEWLAGPKRLADPPDANTMPKLLGEATELRSFVGVVSGDDGPWGVALHVARVLTDGDAVIAAGGQRTPVGSADGVKHRKLWLQKGAKLTAESIERLERKR